MLRLLRQKALITGEIIRNSCTWLNENTTELYLVIMGIAFCKLTHTWCNYSLKLLKFYTFSSILTKKRTKITDINAFALFHQQGFP